MSFSLRRRITSRDGGEAVRTNNATTNAPPVIPRERYGLFELSSNEDNIEKTLDIVAVHGLQGDAFKTWEHENGSIWIRDFLPNDVPFARIFTFGYESAVFSRSAATIEDKSLLLLNKLALKRERRPDEAPRAILFICHSLGGIIVKKALNMAHDRSSDPDFRDILDNTKAIAFLGVPRKLDSC